MPTSNAPTPAPLSGKLNIHYSYSIKEKTGKGTRKTAKTHGLTPDEINELFLHINATIKERSGQDRFTKLSFAFSLHGHITRENEEEDLTDIIIVNELFSSLASMEQFLKKYTGLVIPSDEIQNKTADSSYDLYSEASDEHENYFAPEEVEYTDSMTYGYDNKTGKDDENEETIDRVYKKILGLTQKYHADSRKNGEHELSNKDKLFNQLEAVLTNTEQTKYQRLQGFATMLKSEDKNILNQHRTPAWIRFLTDALSFLTLLPAAVRAGHSYSQYGTVQFWKPASEQIKISVLEECKTLNMLIP